MIMDPRDLETVDLRSLVEILIMKDWITAVIKDDRIRDELSDVTWPS